MTSSVNQPAPAPFVNASARTNALGGSARGHVHAALKKCKPMYNSIGVDTEELNIAYPNFSASHPPDPEAMVHPFVSIYYYVVTAGERVGIFSDPNDLEVWHLPTLPFYCMKRFETWDAAMAYYMRCVRAKEVHLTSTFLHRDNGHSWFIPSTGPGATRNTVTSTAPAASCSSGSATSTGLGVTRDNTAPAATTWNIVNTTVSITPASLLNPSHAPPVTAPAAQPAPAVPVQVSAKLDPPAVPRLNSSDLAAQVASPFGAENQPIMVSSAFPTPKPPSGSKARPISIADRSAKVARFRQTILAAMTSPTPRTRRRSSGSKSPSPKEKNLAVTKSRAATRIRHRSKGKGKAKAIDVIMTSEDKEEAIPHDPHPSEPAGPTMASSSSMAVTAVAPIFSDNDIYIWGFSDDEGEPPRPRTPHQPPVPVPPKIQVTAALPSNAPEPPQSINPFLYSPFKHSPIRCPNTPLQTRTPTGPLVSHNSQPPSFEELVQIATKTPKPTSSQNRLAIIKETLSQLASNPIPHPHPRTPSSPGSQIRLAQIKKTLSEKASASKLPATPIHIIVENAFAEHALQAKATNLALTSTPTRSSPSAFAPSESFVPSTVSTPLSFPYSSSPESEFGLSGELTAEILEEASALLDQTCTKPT